MRPHPGVEALQPEIDRVGAIFHGRMHAIPVAGRRKDFRSPRGAFRRGGGC
jgi:hypothetical protein